LERRPKRPSEEMPRKKAVMPPRRTPKHLPLIRTLRKKETQRKTLRLMPLPSPKAMPRLLKETLRLTLPRNEPFYYI